MQESKIVVWEGLTNRKEEEQRRGAKDKGERERCAELNAEFQGIARGDKKSALSEQCKEIDESNRIGQSRDLFKKIRDTKGTFHAKMGTIKKWYGPKRSRR